MLCETRQAEVRVQVAHKTIQHQRQIFQRIQGYVVHDLSQLHSPVVMDEHDVLQESIR